MARNRHQGILRNTPTMSELSFKSAKREGVKTEGIFQERARMGPRELWLLLRIYCLSFITTLCLLAEMLMEVSILLGFINYIS